MIYKGRRASYYFPIFYIKIANELMNKWKQIPNEEMIPLRQHMLAVALKSIIKTSFGDDYFKTNKEILEFESAYDVVCLKTIKISIL